MVIALFNIIFSDEIQPKITWTGKTNKKNLKKIALKAFTKIMKLMTSLSRAADIKFTDKLCEETIVYKILKYAYRVKSAKAAASNANIPGINHSSTEEIPSLTNGKDKENPVIQTLVPSIEHSSIPTSGSSQPFQQPAILTAPPQSHLPYSYGHPVGNWMNGNIWPQQLIMQAQTQNANS